MLSMKKLIVTAVFGIAGLAAFAGTCTITRVSLTFVKDNTYKTYAAQLDNSSGIGILEHQYRVVLLDSGNNIVETHQIGGCLRSVPNGGSDYFSVDATSSTTVVTGLSRLALLAEDPNLTFGAASSSSFAIGNINVNRDNTNITVSFTVTNNGSAVWGAGGCVVVRDASGNVLYVKNYTATAPNVSLAGSATTSLQTVTIDASQNIANADASLASSVSIFVDGTDASGGGNPVESFGVENRSIGVCGTATSTATNTPAGSATATSTNTATATPTGAVPTSTATPTATVTATPTAC